jgi:hypothetical protein
MSEGGCSKRDLPASENFLADKIRVYLQFDVPFSAVIARFRRATQ